MTTLKSFTKISDYTWEIPTSYRKDMRVPVRFFATRKLLEASLNDLSIEQAINASTLPGVVGRVVVMPDMHQGYGFPIGGVAATRFPEGVISPGAIGYDINCGVRLLASTIELEAATPFLSDLAVRLDQACPSGVGKKSDIFLSGSELDQVCRMGSKWALMKGLATEQDIRRTEDEGCLRGADPAMVSSRAKERGRPQLGTLGSGNHFLEVDVVADIYNSELAQVMGLNEGCIVLQIHCGSRGFGHQICSDYVKRFQSVVRQYDIQLPDRELVCAPLNSKDGEAYLGAMRSAANYAFANRQILANSARNVFVEIFSGKVRNPGLYQVYDLAHNIGKIETHLVEGETMQVCIHRKGATRAFGPGTQGLPQEFLASGQPVLVPGSMGTASWVLAGTQQSMLQAFGSSCHGAGRVLSRSKAKKQVRGKELLMRLERKGIVVRAGSISGLAEEAPEAYKDVDAVVETVIGAGIAQKVVRLEPLLVIKG
jgi:tRNA-splicing ligase RtcB